MLRCAQHDVLLHTTLYNVPATTPAAGEKRQINVPVMADLAARNESPEILFWVGCAGAFDDRYKRVTRAFVRILEHVGIKYAVLGLEESCTGDPAKRAGNEFLFQMQAMQNITTLNGYGIKKIVTACPHCFNTIKNEYPALGGDYEVIHHSTYLQQLINEGKVGVTGRRELQGPPHHLPRLLLPGPRQQHLRSPARRAGRPRRRPGGDEAQPRQRPVLRRRRCPDVERSRARQKGNQHRAHRGSPGHA